MITNHQRHRRTDGQTTCDGKTALCTMHSASRGKNYGLLLGYFSYKTSNCAAHLYVMMFNIQSFNIQLTSLGQYQTKLDNILQSVAAKAMGPIAWVMPILIAVTSCSSFNSGTMVASRFLHVLYTQYVHFSTLAAHVIRFYD